MVSQTYPPTWSEIMSKRIVYYNEKQQYLMELSTMDLLAYRHAFPEHMPAYIEFIRRTPGLKLDESSPMYSKLMEAIKRYGLVYSAKFGEIYDLAELRRNGYDWDKENCRVTAVGRQVIAPEEESRSISERSSEVDSEGDSGLSYSLASSFSPASAISSSVPAGLESLWDIIGSGSQETFHQFKKIIAETDESFVSTFEESTTSPIVLPARLPQPTQTTINNAALPQRVPLGDLLASAGIRNAFMDDEDENSGSEYEEDDGVATHPRYDPLAAALEAANLEAPAFASPTVAVMNSFRDSGIEIEDGEDEDPGSEYEEEEVDVPYPRYDSLAAALEAANLEVPAFAQPTGEVMNSIRDSGIDIDDSETEEVEYSSEEVTSREELVSSVEVKASSLSSSPSRPLYTPLQDIQGIGSEIGVRREIPHPMGANIVVEAQNVKSRSITSVEIENLFLKRESLKSRVGSVFRKKKNGERSAGGATATASGNTGGLKRFFSKRG